MNPAWRACIALGAVLLSSCASTHNLATDGVNLFGGGYLESKVHEGIYKISVKTNWAPWINRSAARKSWRDRATALCGSDQFRELVITEDNYEAMPAMVAPYIITTRDGYAVCASVKLSDEAALALIGRS